MQTKKALGILSKGDKQYEGPVGPLAEQAERFAKAYDERENNIIAAKNRDTVIQPVLDVLRRKATKVASEQDRSTPIAMRFDAYQEIKAAADQTQDRGLIHLAKQLEQMWHKDPMGSITLGQLSDLKAHYERNYPRSKIASTVDKAISKVSYAKLPVAKLARLAAKIEDQDDFDHVIVTAGLDGDRPDQVKARTLIRELVAMRGAVVDGREPTEKDTRTATERASDRIAQELFAPPVDEPAVDGVPGGAVDDMALVDLEPAAPVDEGDLEGVGGEADATDLARQVQEFTQNEVAPSLPGIEQYNEEERAEGGAGPVDDPIAWAFEEGREESGGQPTHSVSPSEPGWVQEELAEHGGDAGVPGENFGDDLPPVGKEPLPPMMARKASGMDAPKPKTHPKVTTYAPDRSKDGGAELTKDETKKDAIKQLPMTAAEIETALIDRGETVKLGSVSIHVNDQDEVELWVRDAGFAAPLSALDTAIADFMKHASEHLNPNVDQRGSFALVELVPVPCSRCASISHFEPVEDTKTGVYACDCGNRTRAATIDSLVRHGQLKMAYVLRIDLPADYVKQADVKAASEQLLDDAIVPHVRQAKLDAVQGRSLEVWLPEADIQVLRKVSKALTEFGLVPVQIDKMAQFAGDIKAPGSADMPVQQDVAPQNVKPGADKGSPAIEDPSTHQEPDVAASFHHYKSMGIGFIEAIAQFKKDFPEWVENHSTPDFDAQIIEIGQQLYTGGVKPPAGAAPADAVPPGTPAPATAGSPAPAPMQAQAFKNPSVNAQQPDAVSVAKQPLGKEEDSGHPAGLKQPAVKVKHPAKQKSPTDLGTDSDDKDLGRFKAPTPPKDGHVPGKAGDQPGTKAPPTDMGKDSDSDGKKSIPTPGKFGPRPKA